jgi:uncharacterized protein DUF5329
MKQILTLLLMLVAMPLFGGWDEEKSRIDYLLQQIRQVDGVFIRNGTAHQPADAVAHLEMKLKRATDSWFAPDREEWTADMFIEKLASKSSLTGTLYRIQFNDGRSVIAGDWLTNRLKNRPPPSQ